MSDYENPPIDARRALIMFFLVSLTIGGSWFCFRHADEEDRQHKQERIDKCVEQTGDAKFCWEKYG